MLTLNEVQLCLGSLYSDTKIAKFVDIFNGFLESGLTITRGISRYTSWVSQRSWFRFLSLSYDWVGIRVRLLKHFCFDSGKVYLLVAGETVEAKSGICSHGLSMIYSSTAGKSINGVCFLGMSIVDTSSRSSYFEGIEQNGAVTLYY